jgi:hypothetical protein
MCGAVAAQAASATCLLQVKGKTFINGPCDYVPGDLDDGSFYIGLADSSYFAYLVPSGINTISGDWNEDKFASHAMTSLGEMYKDGPCWISPTAKVCVWK